MDELLKQARAEPDATKRYADYNNIGKLIMEDVPEIPIYYYGHAWVVSPQVVNWAFDAMARAALRGDGRRSIAASPVVKLMGLPVGVRADR